MEEFHFVAWLVGIAVLCASDVVWFKLTGNAVYHFNKLLDDERSSGQAALYIFLCATFASAVLTTFRGTSAGDAAIAGALIGGLVFFVFNACACYIINNLKYRNNDTEWRWYTAMADIYYGAALYTATALVIFEVANA